MTSGPVTLERRDGVLIAHLDDGKANALSTTMITAIESAIDEADGDESVSALVLHGRPGKFCAGFDLEVMRGGDFGAIAALVSDGGSLVHRIYGSSVPVVAACTGHALAAGALLLLACDLRIGADVECKVGLNEVAIGMVLPDWAMTISVERLSKRHLQRAVATAEITSGAGAVEAGFLDRVVPEADVLAAAVVAASQMAGLSRRAYAGTVRSLRGATLDLMERQVAADRAAGNVPTA